MTPERYYVKVWDQTPTDVYFHNRLCKKKIVVNQGGTYSSKTYSIVQNIIDFAIENPLSVSTITAGSYPQLKQDALRIFKKLIIEPLVNRWIQNPESVVGAYRFYNGSIIEFAIYDDIGKARGAKRDLLYISEANNLHYDIAEQLIKRTEKKVFIDYNPVSEFWVHEELLHLPITGYIQSNYKHNQYNTAEKVSEIEGYYARYLETRSEYDLNKWKVYGLGETGIVEGLVFPNIRRITEFPDNYYLRQSTSGHHFVYGVDFGYSFDPTAIVKTGVRNGNNESGVDRLVGKQMFYQTGFNSFELSSLLPTLGITKQDILIADPSHGEAIDVLAGKGWNIKRAAKPSGSIKSGIELINKHGIDLTVDSNEWLTEQKQYQYRKTLGRYDKNVPIDKYNHAWDAARYAASYLINGSEGKPSQIQRRRRRAVVA